MYMNKKECNRYNRECRLKKYHAFTMKSMAQLVYGRQVLDLDRWTMKMQSPHLQTAELLFIEDEDTWNATASHILCYTSLSLLVSRLCSLFLLVLFISSRVGY